MFLIGRLSPRRQPGLILAGAAAGVAAAFNTPLAGIVFAIEEMSRSFEVRASGLIIAAVILAGLTAQSLLGNYTYFGFSTAALPIGTAWMAVPLCGVIGGFAGALFTPHPRDYTRCTSCPSQAMGLIKSGSICHIVRNGRGALWFCEWWGNLRNRL